jgi:hypothetical protein
VRQHLLHHIYARSGLDLQRTEGVPRLVKRDYIVRTKSFHEITLFSLSEWNADWDTDALYPTFTDEKKKADLPMKIFW